MSGHPNHPYASPLYAKAFTPEYKPVFLEQANAWVLLRPIPNTPNVDAIGCYPLCPMNADADLDKDFQTLRAHGVVSLVLVTDTFFQPPQPMLERYFDQVTLYKEHFLNDFTLPNLYESKNHHYKVRRALRDCEVKIISLTEYMDEWCALYDAIIIKHDIHGIQAFSRHYFEALCALNPVTVGAFVGGRLVSCQICLEYDGHVYSHLVASNAEGYEIRASYALYDFSLRHFAGAGAKLYDLGSGAGVSDASGGLTLLKKGFSTTSRHCFLCGKILDKERYAALSQGKQANFFPAYRGS